MTEIILKVGRRGEIYTTKEIRERLGIKKGGKVVAYIVDNMLMIVPLPSIEEKIKCTILKLSPKEVEEISEEIQREVGVYG